MLAAVGRTTDRIVYRSINRAEDNSQTRAVDLIWNVLNLTKTRIRQDFRKIRAYAGRLSGQLVAEGGPVGFMSFSGTRELVRGGVSYRLKRTGGSRGRLSHAFIERGRGGQEQVFEREEWHGRTWRPNYPYAKMPRDYRLPLDRVAAVAIEDYFKDNRIYTPVHLYSMDRLEHHMLDQAEYELSRI